MPAAALDHLHRGAYLGDPWALLLLSAAAWEGEAVGGRDRRSGYLLAGRYVRVAAQLVQEAGEQRAAAARRVRLAAAAAPAAAVPAAPAPAPGYQLQCTGSLCRLAPLPAAGRGGAPRRAAPALPAPPPPAGEQGPPGSSALGSYDAVAGSEAAWADLQVGASTAAAGCPPFLRLGCCDLPALPSV